jgi:AcrR family transcriptional regulator
MELRGAGFSYAMISERLGISKSSVAYHCRNSQRPVDEKAARRYDWAMIRATVEAEQLSMHAAMRRFGFTRDTWAKAVARGAVTPISRVKPISEILCVHSRADRGQVKRRLLEEGLKASVCEVCEVATWMGEPLALHLHHINGDGRDNRLENLQLLCPNCHSQTDTFAGRNRGRMGGATRSRRPS